MYIPPVKIYYDLGWNWEKGIFIISYIVYKDKITMNIKVILNLLNLQRHNKLFTVIIMFIIFLSIETFFVPSLTQTTEQKVQQITTTIKSQILFAPMDSKITYLIDNTGVINHTWTSNYLPGVGVRWLGDGTILRTIRVGVGPGTGGAGGGVQKVTWDGTVVWDFRYNTNGLCTHHDVRSLPNGNVLLIAWETKTRTEAIAAGRNPNVVSSNGLYPDHIIEVQPTGSTSGTIVWEWHVWDHLIQDYDVSKVNYGVVGDQPELVDINYGASSDMDWMHTNSIDYNEKFDQILISVCYFDEIWIIDHSTTTAEAASHTGGNSGKGGDLLYRWGNPAAYRAGIKSNQKLFNQHDASWIDEGCPGAGNILIFNNQAGGSSSRYSSVDEIIPPVNENGEYYLASGSAYGPTVQTWRYTATPATSLYSSHLSGAERLTDGSTLICNGEPGKFFQVTSTGTTVWTYTNPYPAGAANNVFKIVYIPSDEESSNQPPYTPRNPVPVNGTTGVSVDIDLSWTGGDPDVGDTVVYDVYFGTSSTPPKVSTAQSGTRYNPETLSNDTNYYWRIVAWDKNGNSTVGPVWDFTTVSTGNNPPSTPSITGETNGAIRTSYYYTIQTTDPDQDDVKYNIDWGDNTTITGLYKSGEEIAVSHAWEAEGNYNIKVKAIDTSDAESNWATLTVTMPYSYNNPILQLSEWLFQRFPHMFPILKQMLGY